MTVYRAKQSAGRPNLAQQSYGICCHKATYEDYISCVAFFMQTSNNESRRITNIGNFVVSNYRDYYIFILKIIKIQYTVRFKGKVLYQAISYIKCYLRTPPPIMKSQRDGIVPDIVVSDYFVYNSGADKAHSCKLLSKSFPSLYPDRSYLSRPAGLRQVAFSMAFRLM